jgi:hypothetical protein
VPRVQSSVEGTHAYECMSVLLRLQELRHFAQTPAR